METSGPQTARFIFHSYYMCSAGLEGERGLLTVGDSDLAVGHATGICRPTVWSTGDRTQALEGVCVKVTQASPITFMGKTSYLATPSVWGTGKGEPPIVSGRRRELSMLVAIIKLTSPPPTEGLDLNWQEWEWLSGPRRNMCSRNISASSAFEMTTLAEGCPSLCLSVGFSLCRLCVAAPRTPFLASGRAGS